MDTPISMVTASVAGFEQLLALTAATLGPETSETTHHHQWPIWYQEIRNAMDVWIRTWQCESTIAAPKPKAPEPIRCRRWDDPFGHT